MCTNQLPQYAISSIIITKLLTLSDEVCTSYNALTMLLQSIVTFQCNVFKKKQKVNYEVTKLTKHNKSANRGGTERKGEGNRIEGSVGARMRDWHTLPPGPVRWFSSMIGKNPRLVYYQSMDLVHWLSIHETTD